MSEASSGEDTKTCFVIMGFGKKTDFETGRTLDLDMSYHNLIKPAVVEAGLKCIRADEIVHSGIIDLPMYEQLLTADVVVADLSTSNKNAFYELGIRHALRPYTTVVIAEDGIKVFPFDLNHVVVRQYRHLGEDIGYKETMRFREELTKAIRTVLANDSRSPDSPVYTFLNNLTPPSRAAAVQKAVQAMVEATPTPPASGGSALPDNTTAPDETHSTMMRQVDEAQKRDDFVTARALLRAIREMQASAAREKQREAAAKTGVAPAGDPREDPYILQRLALVTYKSKQPNELESLIEAHHILRVLEPETSNDTETLGLWQAVHKRLWTLKRERPYLDEAVRAAERGFYLRNDYYNGINLAFLLNERAAASTSPAEAVADFVQARRVRREVLAICERWLRDNPAQPGEDAAAPDDASRYWVLATRAEAAVGLDDSNADTYLSELAGAAPAGWMKDSTMKQIAELRNLLRDSPLRFLRDDAASG